METLKRDIQPCEHIIAKNCNVNRCKEYQERFGEHVSSA